MSLLFLKMPAIDKKNLAGLFGKDHRRPNVPHAPNNGNRLGQGRDNARKFLIENPAVGKEIHEKILLHQDELLKNMDIKPWIG